MRTDGRKHNIAGKIPDRRKLYAFEYGNGMLPFGNGLSGFPGANVSDFVPIYSPGMGADDVLVPQDDKTLRALVRYFYDVDEFVGSAIDIHTEIPLSRFVLLPPKTETDDGAKLAKYSIHFFEQLVEDVDLFDKIIEISREFRLMNEVFIYHEYDEENKTWSDIIVLDPDSIEVEGQNLSGEEDIYLVPAQEVIDFIKDQKVEPDRRRTLEDMLSNFDEEFIEEVRQNGKVKLNTDPSKGSFVFHFVGAKQANQDRPKPALMRVLKTLIYRDQIRSAQSLVTQRNLANIHLVSAEAGDTGLDDDQFRSLEAQADLALNTPDFVLVTDFPVTWQVITGQNRMTDYTSEYAETSERLFVGTGLTSEIMKGEGLYSSGRISIEILNLRYQLQINRLKRYLEKFVFKPLAIVNKLSEEVKIDVGDETLSIIRYLHPKVSFSRTTLYDSESVFEMLWNIYLKGSLSIRTIFDVMSLDYDSEMEKLLQDMLSPADAQFNELTRGILEDARSYLVENTNIMEILKEKIRDAGIDLKDLSEEEAAEMQGQGGGEMFGPGGGPGGFEPEPDFDLEGPGEGLGDIPEVPSELPGGPPETPTAPPETPTGPVEEPVEL